MLGPRSLTLERSEARLRSERAVQCLAAKEHWVQGVLCEDLECHVDVVIGRDAVGPVIWHFFCVEGSAPVSILGGTEE